MYTRVYSNSSAGKLISGKKLRGYPTPPLSDAALHSEFRNHANRQNREPTALVSASKHIIDTLKRAVEKYEVDDESPENIWIVFLSAPPAPEETRTRIH